MKGEGEKRGVECGRFVGDIGEGRGWVASLWWQWAGYAGGDGLRETVSGDGVANI